MARILGTWYGGGAIAVYFDGRRNINMKKHMLIAVSSLVLATGLHASQRVGREHCFRPAFQKKLKRVKPVGLRSFNARGCKQNFNKKAVFIDWRKLYWGKLGDLIYSEEETYADDAQGVEGTEVQNIDFLDSQESKDFAKELRRELKAFAKQYGLKIMWRKKSLGITDATAAFLEYWDKGFSREEAGKAIPFAELCALSVSDTSIRDTNAKDTSIRDTSIRDTSIGVTAIRDEKVTNAKGASARIRIKDASFSNPFLEKEA